MSNTGKVKKGEEWIGFYAPIIEPEEKQKPKTPPRKKRRSKLEERMFLLECVEAGLITREHFDNIVKRKHP